MQVTQQLMMLKLSVLTVRVQGFFSSDKHALSFLYFQTNKCLNRVDILAENCHEGELHDTDSQQQVSCVSVWQTGRAAADWEAVHLLS